MTRLSLPMLTPYLQTDRRTARPHTEPADCREKKLELSGLLITALFVPRRLNNAGLIFAQRFVSASVMTVPLSPRWLSSGTLANLLGGVLYPIILVNLISQVGSGWGHLRIPWQPSRSAGSREMVD